MDGIDFKFFLNFKNDNSGLVQIAEPEKFDGATFTIEQDANSYGRDVIYGNDEVELTFYNDYYDNGLNHAFDLLIQYYKDYGFESQIEFILQKNGIDFTIGILDFQLASTDQITYLKCKVIQETTIQAVKRRDEVDVDVFSDEDLDGNPITPVSTKRILLKAKPQVQQSEWLHQQQGQFIARSSYIYDSITNTYPDVNTILATNSINTPSKYGIENTLSNFSVDNSLLPANPIRNDAFVFIEAKNDLLDVKIELTNIDIKAKSTFVNFAGANISSASGKVKFVILYGYTTNTLYSQYTEIVLHEKDFIFENSEEYQFPDTYNVTIPLINAGMRVYVYVLPTSTATFNTYTQLGFGLTKYAVGGFMNNGKMSIKVNSKTVDTVINGVRHIDYFKQCVKSATGLNVIAPRYDVGGEHYNNFVFNGKLIRQFVNEPFYGTIKENFSHIQELNASTQTNKDNVYLSIYDDFYSNNEAGAFLTVPDESFTSEFNKRYTVQTLEYKYKSFEQDKDEENTLDSVHTHSKYLLPNKNVEGNKKVEVDFVRDYNEIESTKRQAIYTKENISLSNDDKVYIIDCIEIAPNTRNTLVRILDYKEENTQLKILADSTFRWDVLGFQVGDVININGTNRTVISITPSILTTSYGGGTSNGSIVFTINYPLTNVEFVTRANEGFTITENFLIPERTANLRYTIRRNLRYFESYLKTCTLYKVGKTIKNTYFKSNRNAKTQYQNGTIYIEGENIAVNSLANPILSPLIYKTRVVADFEDVYNLLLNMQTINSDYTIGGFIRIMDNEQRVIKVYPKKLDYTWATEVLEIEGEQRIESEYLDITSSGGLIIIDEVGYPKDIVANINIITDGDYIQLFDNRTIALCNKIKFDKVRVNSQIFSNIVELSDALLTL